MLYNDQVLQEPNPDFCRSYKNVDGFLAWEGYGIDSIVSFLGDVESLNTGRCTLQELEGKRPTFSESILTSAVIEAAEESLNNNSNWIDVNV